MEKFDSSTDTESRTLNLFSELEKYDVHLSYDDSCGSEAIAVKTN